MSGNVTVDIASSKQLACVFANDDTFGPSIPNRCRPFDFSLLFEQAFLSMVPSLLLICLSILRLARISRLEAKTFPNWTHSAKLILTGSYVCLQLCLLVVSALPSTPRTKLSLATSVFSFVGSILICLLSHLEHTKSVRPSAILNIYWFISVLFDIVQLRTFWKIPALETFASISSVALVVKVALLVFEAWEKDSFLTTPYRYSSPEAKSSIYNRSLFWWLNSIFLDGFKKVLIFDDLHGLDRDLSSEYLAKKAQAAWFTADKSQKHALFWTIASCLRWPFLAPALPRIALIGFNFSQPFFIRRLITYVGNHKSTGHEKNVGYGLIGAAAFIYIGIAISNGRYQHANFRSMTMVRGALSALIYGKTLDLQILTAKDTQALTLMSTDIDSIINALKQMHEIWAGSIEVVVAMYLLGRAAGVACLTPAILGLAGTAANSLWVGPQLKARRPVWNAAIQRRISLTSSMLKDMKALKMLGLAARMESLLQEQRIHELEQSKAVRWMIIWTNMFANLMPIFSKAFVLMAVALQDDSFSSADAYAIMSVLNLASTPLTNVTSNIPNFMGCIGCFGRIQRYLLLKVEKDDRIIDEHPAKDLTDRFKSVDTELQTVHRRSNLFTAAINLEKCAMTYSAHAAAVTCLDSWIQPGTLNMIVGPVGSGKTTLLLGLLGEMRIAKGSIRMKTANIAYCQQSSWLPNQTIRETVVGIDSVPFDRAWYEQVVFSCGLDVDISRLPDGDNTLVGSRGLVLSGGQRQRLALARAVHARRPIILLDDIFSALDARTEQIVLERLFMEQGLFRQRKTTVILATHAINHLHLADNIIVLDKTGAMIEQGSFPELKAKCGYVEALGIAASQQEPHQKEEQHTTPAAEITRTPHSENIDDARRLGDFSVYGYYARRVGRGYLCTLLGLQFAKVSFLSLPQLWVKFWTADKGHRSSMYISVMFAFALAAWCLNFSALWLMLVRIVPLSGRKLHWILVSIIIAAPLSFFAKTDVGVILNRFSQDMTLIDTQLPIALLQTSLTICQIIWNTAFVCYGAYYLIAFVPFLVGVVYAIQSFYLRTSRQLRLLDLEMKSPLYTHFTETQEGLVTIRAFQWQKSCYDRFLHKLDDSQRPFYLLFMVQQWLGFCLGLVVASIAILLVAFATQFKQQSSGSAIGIALLNVIELSASLTTLISYWTQLETSIGSVARLKQLEEDVKSEDLPDECHSLPVSWPNAGAIIFDNVTAGYGEDLPAVLHDISLSISPGEKVGVCGRTGSGKSTLISLLFRLLPVRSGSITVDNISLSKYSSRNIREHLIAIPQDPYILSGTVRFNAAPHFAAINESTVTDDEIISALVKVHLWQLISSRGGLEASMVEIGLSQGQEQLFCLARAVLRKESSKILILDEATSSVDMHTDKLMRMVIGEEFKNHTIISVAHRLSSLVDYDKVVVMNEGRIVEVGNPRALLDEEGSWWRRLWDMQN